VAFKLSSALTAAETYHMKGHRLKVKLFVLLAKIFSVTFVLSHGVGLIYNMCFSTGNS
jgi:hypothetical protein